jgi:Tol biopolymer transport system component
VARPHFAFRRLAPALSLLLALVCAAPAGADEIAYNCGDDICVIDPDGGGAPTRLTETAAGKGYESFPVWSPDGTRIAYRGLYIDNGFEDWNVYVLDPAEAAPRTVVDVSQDDERETDFAAPSWSPDGARLTWSSTSDSSAVTPRTAIYAGAADGASPPYRVGDREGSHPVFSADGTKIAFGSGPEAVYLAPALSTGTAAFLAPFGIGLEPVWSPDGKWIATHRWNSNPYKVRVVAADGSAYHELPRPMDLSSTLDWSADSTKLTYVADEEPALDQVRVVPADGSNEGVVIPMPPGWVVPHGPKLSPDGSRVVFYAQSNGTPPYEQLLIAPSDGSAVATPLTTAAEQAEQPDWKPTGTNPNGPVNPGGGGAGGTGGGGATSSGGGATGGGGSNAPKPTQAPHKVNLAFFKEPRITGTGGTRSMLAVSVDCHAQGGHPTGWVAEYCAANASAFARGAAPAGLRPNARAKGGAKVLFAKGAVKVPEGKSKPLAMKLTAAGMKLLKKGKRLTLTLTVTSKRGTGKATTSTKTVTVTPPRPKH